MPPSMIETCVAPRVYVGLLHANKFLCDISCRSGCVREKATAVLQLLVLACVLALIGQVVRGLAWKLRHEFQDEANEMDVLLEDVVLAVPQLQWFWVLH